MPTKTRKNNLVRTPITREDGVKSHVWKKDPHASEPTKAPLKPPNRSLSQPAGNPPPPNSNPIADMMGKLQTRRQGTTPPRGRENPLVGVTTTKHPTRPELKQVVALKDNVDHGVKVGQIGGWVENVDNIRDNAWVAEGGLVEGDAVISGNAHVRHATVKDKATVKGDAFIVGGDKTHPTIVKGSATVEGFAYVYGGTVSGTAHVFGDAEVTSGAHVTGEATVSGDARLRDEGQVYGAAVVQGNARVERGATVSGNAVVAGDAKLSGSKVSMSGGRVNGLSWVKGRVNITGTPTLTDVSLDGESPDSNRYRKETVTVSGNVTLHNIAAKGEVTFEGETRLDFSGKTRPVGQSRGRTATRITNCPTSRIAPKIVTTQARERILPAGVYTA